MDKMKSTLLTPETLEVCLGGEKDFHVIKNKHDITLSLNSIDEHKYKYIADQTPTPTNLIRNCEEIGLFDDLKHVNPFEETFRQAIDGKSKESSILLSTQKSLEVIKNNDEDTLHTPNIFPYNSTIADNKSVKLESEKKTINDLFIDKQPGSGLIERNESSGILQISSTSKDKVESDLRHDTNTISDCKERNTLMKIEPLENSPSQDVTPKVFRKIYPKPVVVPVICNISNPIKEKIRQSLLKLQTTKCSAEAKIPIVKFHNLSPKQSEVRDFTKVEIKRQLIQKNNNNNNNACKDNGSNERNREAAKRYRNKQKMLHDAVLLRNKQLEAENSLLKKQFQAFKRAHENCSVSQNCDTSFYE